MNGNTRFGRFGKFIGFAVKGFPPAEENKSKTYMGENLHPQIVRTIVLNKDPERTPEGQIPLLHLPPHEGVLRQVHSGAHL